MSRLKEHPFLARRAAGVKKLMPSARTVDVPNIQGIGGGGGLHRAFRWDTSRDMRFLSYPVLSRSVWYLYFTTSGRTMTQSGSGGSGRHWVSKSINTTLLRR